MDWDKNIAALKEHYAKHHHVRINHKAEPELSEFVLLITMRHKDHYSQEQQAQLVTFGDVFEHDGQHSLWNTFQRKWYEKYQQLSGYKKNHGSIHIPKDCKENPVLASFVANNRRSKKIGKLLLHRKVLLEDLGIQWTPGKVLMNRLTSKEDARWLEMYTLLKDYKEKYGHTMVPQTLAGLGSWVKNQRRIAQRGEFFRDDRFVLLEELGFDWRLRDNHQNSLNSNGTILLTTTSHVSHATNPEKWELQYNEYKKLQEEGAHYGSPILLRWANNQRKRAREESLSAKERLLLEQIGFFQHAKLIEVPRNKKRDRAESIYDAPL